MKISRRKIPRFGLLAGLLLVGTLVVALAAPVLAASHPIVVYGDVELDLAAAPVGTEIEIYLDDVSKATTTVTTAGEYGPAGLCVPGGGGPVCQHARGSVCLYPGSPPAIRPD